jgi:type VI secretion system protein ImpK
MREQLGRIVYPILSYGLALKQRLELGEQPALEMEQAQLKRLLLTDNEALHTAEFGGDRFMVDQGTAVGLRPSMNVPGTSKEAFLGARYALVCWLDEIFILDCPQTRDFWNEHKLEPLLYPPSAERAWRFWEQAQKAQARPGADGLEVFYLCVMLGFRGDYREQTEKLGRWVAACQTRIEQIQSDAWVPPNDAGDPPGSATPRRAQESFQNMLVAASLVILAWVFVGAFLIVQGLAR